MTNLSYNQLKSLVANEVKKFLHSNDFELTLLPASASSRRYFRVTSQSQESFIATYHEDVRENIAFVEFTKAFHRCGLPVPWIFHFSPDKKIYFQTDLGDITLFNLISTSSLSQEELLNLLKKALDDLFKFQTCLDVPYEFPCSVDRFDEKSLRWDLNYFKYLFLKIDDIIFDELQLEKDFDRWITWFLSLPSNFFMYRDFQTRNILIHNGKLFYIDYQGGRRGTLLYDLASFLFDAKANFSVEIREQLLSYYAQKLHEAGIMTYDDVMKYFPYVALTRLMQAFGAYGYRGLYERKSHFIASIPLAARNLAYLLSKISIEKEYPELYNAFMRIIEKHVHETFETNNETLHVHLFSFSLRKGYPLPHSEHGGGFIFDCRSLPNPGREKQFEPLTGMDTSVINYLTQFPEVNEFIQHSFKLICMTIDNYIQRNFNYLSIGFGCTGGKHRSVFCTNLMATMLAKKYGSKITLHVEHRELG